MTNACIKMTNVCIKMTSVYKNDKCVNKNGNTGTEIMKIDIIKCILG